MSQPYAIIYLDLLRYAGNDCVDQFERTRLLIGSQAMEKLKKSRVAVFGIGGVGGYVVEALVRSGIGALDLVDSDDVSLTNLNRQIIATHKTLNMPKTDAAEERALSINPNVKITKHKVFYTPQTESMFDFSLFDYVVDAVDTVSAKLSIIQKAKECNVPVISSMGAGNKLRPDLLEVDDIYNTSVCPLARAMRPKLRKMGITSLKVVYSKEQPIVINTAGQTDDVPPGKHTVPGSTAFVPSAAGLILAAEVFRDLAFSE